MLTMSSLSSIQRNSILGLDCCLLLYHDGGCFHGRDLQYLSHLGRLVLLVQPLGLSGMGAIHVLDYRVVQLAGAVCCYSCHRFFSGYVVLVEFCGIPEIMTFGSILSSIYYLSFDDHCCCNHRDGELFTSRPK